MYKACESIFWRLNIHRFHVMQTIPLFQSPLSPSGFNYPHSPIRLVKPLYEQSAQAGYESMDNHDGHDIAFDSSHLLYLLTKSEIF